MSDIATKLTYLNTTKGKIKDSINLTGAGITTEPFRQYAVKLKDAYVDIINNGTETLYNNFPKVSGSGTDLSLQNTYEAPMKIDLKGNTSQTGTPTPSSPIPINNVSGNNNVVVCGKNLFDKDNANVLNGNLADGGTLNLTNNARTLYIPCKNNTTYTITKEKAIYFRVAQFTNIPTIGDSYISRTKDDTANSITFTTTTGNYLAVTYWYNTSTNTEQQVLDSIQIEYGNQATTYEAYTGTTYPINLPVENLFDKDNANVLNAYFNSTTPTISQDVGSRTIYIPCKSNTTYTISKTISNRFAIGYTTTTPDLNVSVSGVIQNNSANAITITTGNNATHLVVFMWLSTDTKTYQEIIATIQIEEGSKANTYTQYGTTPIELCKIGTYQDYIYKENDKWYLHKETGKVVLDGSEQNWNSSTSNYYITIDDAMIGSAGLSNYFIYSSTIGTFGYFRFSGSQHWLIFMSVSTQYTRQQWLDWLSTHNTNVYYVLETPTNTEITDSTLLSQLEAIYNAKSKNGTTNINQVNNDLGFIITASALEKEM